MEERKRSKVEVDKTDRPFSQKPDDRSARWKRQQPAGAAYGSVTVDNVHLKAGMLIQEHSLSFQSQVNR